MDSFCCCGCCWAELGIPDTFCFFGEDEEEEGGLRPLSLCWGLAPASLEVIDPAAEAFLLEGDGMADLAGEGGTEGILGVAQPLLLWNLSD